MGHGGETRCGRDQVGVRVKHLPRCEVIAAVLLFLALWSVAKADH